MNQGIEQYFNAVELQLLQSVAITNYQIIRREIGPTDGKLRLKATLTGGGLAEMFEYVTEANGAIESAKYSFHWQDEQGNLKKRWDNAPHFPNLLHAPHHVHLEDGSVQGMSHIPDMRYALQQIEQAL